MSIYREWIIEWTISLGYESNGDIWSLIRIFSFLYIKEINVSNGVVIRWSESEFDVNFIFD